MSRGAWYYSAEEDVGYCAAFRTHATILARDPVFGDVAYGGELTREGKAFTVIPRDGLPVRFHVVRGDQRAHLILDHDGFAREQPIVVAEDLSRIEFVLLWHFPLGLAVRRRSPSFASRRDVRLRAKRASARLAVALAEAVRSGVLRATRSLGWLQARPT